MTLTCITVGGLSVVQDLLSPLSDFSNVFFFHPPFARPYPCFLHFIFVTQSVFGFFSLLFHFFISFHFTFFFSLFFHVFSLHCSVHGFSIFPSFSFDFTVCLGRGINTDRFMFTLSASLTRERLQISEAHRSREGEQGANNKNTPILVYAGDEKKRFAHTSSCRAGQGSRRVDGSEAAE